MEKVVNRPKIVSEPIEFTRERLGARYIRLTDLYIDLIKISRGIAPEFQATAMHYSGPLKEALNITNRELFLTWQQTREVDYPLLNQLVDCERGRLREFLDKPLDDR